MRTSVLFVALLTAAIGAGSAYTTFFLLNPADVTPAFWVTQLQHAAGHIGIPLFAVQPVAALTTMGSAFLARRDRPSFWFLIAAGVLLIAAGLVTRIGHIPINLEMETWNADALPAHAVELQQRWWTLHIVRCSALCLGFCALILGSLTRRGAVDPP